MAVSLSDVDELIETFTQVWRISIEKSKNPFQTQKATMWQLHCLGFIAKHPQLSLGDFAQALHMSASSATQLVERLAQHNLIKRIEDKDDRRIVKLVLTKKGIDTFMRLHNVKRKKLQKLFRKLPKQDCKEFVRICKKLLD